MNNLNLLKHSILVCMLALFILPVNVHAAETVTSSVHQTYSLCHCGGQRLERVTRRYAATYCNEHGASCSNCYRAYEKTYYYCSNSSCIDTYYGPETYVGDIHIYGR